MTPGLAVVIVGEDPASQVYVASKGRMAESCGFKSVKHALPADTPQADLMALVASLNADPTIHGILLQLPLPKPLDPLPVIATIDPAKDVDGLNEVNAGRVALGDFGRAFVPCTPAGSMVLIRSALPGERSRGRHAVVIGRSNLVGKPIAALLLAADCTVTMAHSRTRDLPALCRSADVLVAAVGRPGMVAADWIKPGAVVIDVGINRVPAPERGEGRTRLVGDVDFAGALRRRRGRHARAGRRRPDDHRHADGEHAAGGHARGGLKLERDAGETTVASNLTERNRRFNRAGAPRRRWPERRCPPSRPGTTAPSTCPRNGPSRTGGP